MGKIIDLKYGDFKFIDYGHSGYRRNKKVIKYDNKYFMLKGFNGRKRVFKNKVDDAIYKFQHFVINEFIASKIINLINLDSAKVNDTKLMNLFSELYVANEHHILNKNHEGNIFSVDNDNFYHVENLNLYQNTALDYMRYYVKDTTVKNYYELEYEYTHILETKLEFIEKQDLVDKTLLRKRFWEQFVLDAFLLNYGRDDTNWGFICDKNTNKCELSPLYGHTSTFFIPYKTRPIKLYDEDVEHKLSKIVAEIPKLTDELKEEISKRILDSRAYIIYKDEPLVYSKFIKEYNNEDFFEAIHQLLYKIKLGEIDKLIEKEIYFSKNLQEFYKFVLEVSYNEILVKSLLHNEGYQKWLKEKSANGTFWKY